MKLSDLDIKKLNTNKYALTAHGRAYILEKRQYATEWVVRRGLTVESIVTGATQMEAMNNFGKWLEGGK